MNNRSRSHFLKDSLDIRVGCDINISIRYMREAIVLSVKVEDPDLESSRVTKAGTMRWPRNPHLPTTITIPSSRCISGLRGSPQYSKRGQ